MSPPPNRQAHQNAKHMRSIERPISSIYKYIYTYIYIYIHIYIYIYIYPCIYIYAIYILIYLFIARAGGRPRARGANFVSAGWNYFSNQFYV